MRLGATYLGEGRCEFLVWAPCASRVEVRLGERLVPLAARDHGYHHGVIEGVEPGCRYVYRLDGKLERPDPASRFQPEGVHGPSQIVSPVFPWTDQDWVAPALEKYLIYELHVGTFTPEGTFDAVIPRLKDLKDLGVTVIELMPVAQFPGTRNWGYDGAYAYAVQNSYGGPAALRRLIDACHGHGLAVALDVVYNHIGPEGNYLADFGPYFADGYLTPWGKAMNFDGPDSDEVRRFFIENALQWVVDFHVDALRLDALHAIVDASERPFVQELAATVHEEAERLDRTVFLIGEIDRNDARYVRPVEEGGYGLDAQWSDDFHHSVHALLTGERERYYQDFGTMRHLHKVFMEGYAYTGQYSRYRRRRHGNSPHGLAARQFVVCAQNHDQAGNRRSGERLGALVSFEALKLAAGVTLLSPYVPLLFMGEEYGERAPFLYFTSHSDPQVVEGTRRGRREMFPGTPETPDPQDEGTFARSKLDPRLADREPHRSLKEFYRELIGLRARWPVLAHLSREPMEVHVKEGERLLSVRRWTDRSEAFIAFNFEDRIVTADLPEGEWRVRLDSAAQPRPEKATGHALVHPLSFVLFSKGE
ncbi:MAG: malto-oligosyltrehalose trehalohydrolase [Planctomycetes bacterium]|nr:malto-oligosyltrehalose trehalohydrolase [Planctomycetota bacterium]